jgi:hypothetical protein
VSRRAGRIPGPLVTLAALALLAASAVAATAASIEAEIDRNEATLEDRLTLTLTVIGSEGAAPVLPDLAAFEVVPAGQSKQWNFINGRASSSISYRYLLLPRETGEFVIGPAVVEIDGERLASQPFSVRIRAAGAASGQQSDLFLTTQLSTATPYVGEQVLFTWRLYRRVRIADARLDPFEFNGFLVEDLGEVREFETSVNGRTFMVSEIRKALFPQEQGTLTIPATRLTCQVAQQRGRRRSNSVFDDMFGRVATEAKVLRSDSLQVEIRALPTSPPGFSGLVGSFDLKSKVSQRDTHVGESVTLTLEVSGSGNVQMIPEPPLPELASVKIYNDKPGSKIDRQPSGLRGSRTFRKALVPQVAGTLTLPPVRLIYFDPSADAYRTAATAEISLQVLPAEGEEELRLTETLAPSTGKVAVRILADDILPVYAGIDGIGGPGRPSPIELAAMLLVPLMLYLAALAAARRRRRYRQDAGLERRRRALARARRQLRRISAASGPQATEELSRCVREFLGDKLGLEGVALTAAEARHHLASQGLEQGRIEAVSGLLDRLEAAHYSSAGVAADLPEEVVELLRQLDREL